MIPAGLTVVLAACSPEPPETSPPGRPPALTEPGPAASESLSSTTATPPPILIGAGDVASCDSPGDEATAALLDAALSEREGVVFVAGDAAYPDGTEQQFSDCYQPSWGRHKDRTRPAPGNHDYETPGASGYFGYFGPAAGDSAAGYYSYELGGWHVVALNSNCWAVGGCHPGSPQEQWLREDLAAHPAPCTVAYWHHPLFSSGIEHGGLPEVRPLWQALYDHRADVVVNGHEHTYERFAPQDPGGGDDPLGLRQFVAGTGGRSLYDFGAPADQSEVRWAESFGVLELTLHPDGYQWRFLPTEGSFSDSGTEPCH